MNDQIHNDKLLLMYLPFYNIKDFITKKLYHNEEMTVWRFIFRFVAMYEKIEILNKAY